MIGARHRRAFAGFAFRFLRLHALRSLAIAAIVLFTIGFLRGRNPESEPSLLLAELNKTALWIGLVFSLLGITRSLESELRGPRALSFFSKPIGPWPWLLGTFTGAAIGLGLCLSLAAAAFAITVPMDPSNIVLYQSQSGNLFDARDGSPVQDLDPTLSTTRPLEWRFSGAGETLLLRARISQGLHGEQGGVPVALELRQGNTQPHIHKLELQDDALTCIELAGNPRQEPIRATLRLLSPGPLIAFPSRSSFGGPSYGLRLGEPRTLPLQLLGAQVWTFLRLLPALALALALGSILPPRTAAVLGLALALVIGWTPNLVEIAERLEETGPRALSLAGHPLAAEWSEAEVPGLRARIVGAGLRGLSRALPQNGQLRDSHWLRQGEALSAEEFQHDASLATLFCALLLLAAVLALRRREFR